LDGDDLGDVFGIEIAAPAAKKPKKASSPIKPPEKPKLDKKRRIPQRAGGTPVVPEKLTALAPSRVEPKKKLARKKAAAPKPPAKLAAKPSAKPLAKDLLKAKARARRRRRLAKMKSPGASPAAIGGTGSVRSVANHGGRPSSNKASFGGSDPMGVKKL
jgi:hypothetical protein